MFKAIMNFFFPKDVFYFPEFKDTELVSFDGNNDFEEEKDFFVVLPEITENKKAKVAKRKRNATAVSTAVPTAVSTVPTRSKKDLEKAIAQLRYAVKFPEDYFVSDKDANAFFYTTKNGSVEEQQPFAYFAKVLGIWYECADTQSEEEFNHTVKTLNTEMARVFTHTNRYTVDYWLNGLDRPLSRDWLMVVKYYLTYF
jgi:hypothetical protein